MMNDGGSHANEKKLKDKARRYDENMQKRKMDQRENKNVTSALPVYYDSMFVSQYHSSLSHLIRANVTRNPHRSHPIVNCPLGEKKETLQRKKKDKKNSVLAGN
jgi:hypothetical protein